MLKEKTQDTRFLHNSPQNAVPNAKYLAYGHESINS